MARATKETTAKNKEKLLKALENSLGIVTDACNACRINRTTFYTYYNKDKTFATKVDSLNDVALDFAESSLFEQIKNGIPTSTIFYLKTKGKKRGYIEKQEVDHTTKGKEITPPTINYIVPNDIKTNE